MPDVAAGRRPIQTSIRTPIISHAMKNQARQRRSPRQTTAQETIPQEATPQETTRQETTPQQGSLFTRDRGEQALVRVGVIGAERTLSRAQKAFNRWTKRIEQQRGELDRWRLFNERFQARIAGDIEPLRRRCLALRIDLLRRFDEAHDGGALGKRERARMGRIILDLVSALLEETDDPVLVALHDKYGDVPHEERLRVETARMQAIAEDMLGMTFDEDPTSPEDVVQAAERWFDENEGEDIGPAGEDGAGPDAWPGAVGAGPGGSHRHGRPRSARTQAKFDREQAIAEGATRSLRELYRKLASALHPDREPDPVERERKTQLMKRVNQANEARDLLQLLTLQLEVEQLDLVGLAQVDDTRIAHYNRVLKEQSERLDEEIAALIGPFAMMLPYQRGRSLTPELVMQMLDQDVATLKAESRQLAEELAMFKDVLTLKAWLKTVRLSRARRQAYDDDPAAIIEAMVHAAMSAGAGPAGGAAGGAGRRRRRR